MANRLRLGIIAALTTLWACGGGGDSTESEVTPPTSGDEAAAAATANGPPPERPLAAMGFATTSHGVLRHRPAPEPTAPDARTLYRNLAPQAVIVRTPSSMGTGIIVGDDGLILTNNHVIRGAAHENFRMRVHVEYGHIGDMGSMTPDGEQRDAWVLATDPATDLALLRVENPREGATPVTLAEEMPTPGEHVACLGHGNIGLVWAIRTCEVVATGRLEEQYARLQAVCASEEAAAQRMCEQMRDHFHRRVHGRVIQSSCVIAPGDSGGPLVDDAGHLVGLNVFTMHNEGGQSSNFHVHLAEIREFLANVPTEPMTDLPQPWLTEGESRPLDVDLDGTWDTLAMVGGDRDTARVYDLDQDSAPMRTDQVGDVIEHRRFDAELGVVHRSDGTYVLYDTDADARFDVILSMSHHQQVDAAHRISASGAVTSDPSLVAGPALRAALLPGTSRSRFERVFHGIMSEHGHPEPLPAMLRRAHLEDSDRDGVFDTLRADRADAHVIVFDTDQSTLAAATAENLEQIVSRGIDAEVSLIGVDNVIFAYYDRDGDGVMDTGFRTARNTFVVAEVLTLPGVTEAPNPNDFIGTLAVRPHLVTEGRARLEQQIARQLPSTWYARGNETTGLPHPLDHHRNPTIVEREDVRGWDHAIAAVASRGLQTVLVDVDRNSFRGAAGRRRLAAGIGEAVLGGHFSAEFALVVGEGATWAWYDTDLDGDWDVVLARVDAGGEHVQNAFRWQDDHFVHDASLVEGPPVRPALFPRRQQRTFRAMAGEVFHDDQVQAP